jgi:hypothetical protein
MTGYEVARLLDMLEEQGVPAETLARLEWAWLPALEHDEDRGRGLKALQQALSTDPTLFVDILKIIFRGKDEAPREVTTEESNRATQAYRLLRGWKRIPGLKPVEAPAKADEGGIAFATGSVDATALNEWVQEARQRADECGRLEICDSQLGQLLANSPADNHGRWPCEPVRDLIETLASTALEHGLVVGLHNKRGAFFRASGGDQERRLAEQFRASASKLSSRWPRTSGVLTELAEGYDREAKREDSREEFEEFE